MALLMKYYDNFRIYMETYGDPRTKDWPMMSSPLPTLAVCLSYVILVKVLGPRLMENRKPFQLQKQLVIYNFIQVIFSAWLFYEIGISGWLTGHYSFRCQPVDHSNSPRTIRMVHACWWYYFSKFTEFIDTMFFVMRKKTSQVTTLHVIHHGCMPMSVWFGVKFTPGGHSTFFGLLNTFVHIVMYTYYMFSAMGPQYQKYLWWKKYLTSFQMLQFVAIMVHAFQLLFIECDYPKAFVWWIGMHAVMFLFLFREFYKQAYVQKRRRDAEKKRLLNGAAKALADSTKQNGYTNGTTKLPNGNANGHANGHANGYANGHANGSVHTNGSVANGQVNHSHTNGTSNGHVSTKSDILLRGDLPAEITQRKIQK